MSRHEGVSCDSCLKGNFRGKRYKCLICYDYDLCATCYEAGSTTTRHTTEHPMQCILTRADYDLYFGNESFPVDQPQSFTCPYCGKLGFTEASLQDHVITEHHDVSFDVVCPICAAVPIGEPNLVTDDFAGHLSLEHRNPSRDLISFLDEPQNRHNVGVRRNIPAPSSRSISSRARRSNMHFNSSGALASISPSSRDNVDPIAELLSQLSGVRRNQGSTPTQLHHLQMQLQMERQQAARQQLERMPRRPTGSQQAMAPVGNSPAVINASSLNTQEVGSLPPSQFLLNRYFMDNSLTESQREVSDVTRADRALFVRHVLLSSLRDWSLEGSDNTNRLPSAVLDAIEETPVDMGAEKDETQAAATSNSVSVTAPPAPNCRPPPRGSINAPLSTVPPASANAPQIPVTQRRKTAPNAIHPETAPSTH